MCGFVAIPGIDAIIASVALSTEVFAVVFMPGIESAAVRPGCAE